MVGAFFLELLLEEMQRGDQVRSIAVDDCVNALAVNRGKAPLPSEGLAYRVPPETAQTNRNVRCALFGKPGFARKNVVDRPVYCVLRSFGRSPLTIELQ